MAGLDFAAVFYSFEAALAMTANHPREEEGLAPYPILSGSAQAAGVWFLRATLQVKPLQHTHADQADADQINRDHQIEQPRHHQNQNASDQRHYGRNVSSSDGHQNVSGMTREGNQERRTAPYLDARFHNSRRAPLRQVPRI